MQKKKTEIKFMRHKTLLLSTTDLNCPCIQDIYVIYVGIINFENLFLIRCWIYKCENRKPKGRSGAKALREISWKKTVINPDRQKIFIGRKACFKKYCFKPRNLHEGMLLLQASVNRAIDSIKLKHTPDLTV